MTKSRMLQRLQPPKQHYIRDTICGVAILYVFLFLTATFN